mgnify:CR=1 FL=1
MALFPVIVVTLAGDIPERALLGAARELRDEIENISTVLKVEIAGDRDELVDWGDLDASNDPSGARFFDPQQRDLAYLRYQALCPVPWMDALTLTGNDSTGALYVGSTAGSRLDLNGQTVTVHIRHNPGMVLRCPAIIISE